MAAASRYPFSRNIVNKVAGRTAYICINLACNRLTIGSDVAPPHLSIKRGSDPHLRRQFAGRRYDMSQTEAIGVRSATQFGCAGQCPD